MSLNVNNFRNLFITIGIKKKMLYNNTLYVKLYVNIAI